MLFEKGHFVQRTYSEVLVLNLKTNVSNSNRIMITSYKDFYS